METKRVGRPRTIDPVEVSLVAVRLFESRGYTAVSVDEVAEVAGISRRHLFSLFPSKASLVWGGLDEVGQRLRASLAGSPESENTADALRAAYLSAADFTDDQIEVTRLRLHVIDTHPALAAEGATRMDSLTDVVATFIAQREGLGRDDLNVKVTATTIAAAARTALSWWAIHSDEEPKQVVSRALEIALAPSKVINQRQRKAAVRRTLNEE